MRPGRSQPSLDKQFVRDYLETTGWDKQTPPPPALPDEIVRKTSEKYLEIYRLLTGKNDLCMNGLVDFHVHSNRSCDGDFSPAELVGFAAARGFQAISIADHDTVAAYPEVVEDGRKAGVEIIPGIEVTTLYDGREFHLLLPFVDWGSAGRDRDRRPDDRIAHGRGPGTGRAAPGAGPRDHLGRGLGAVAVLPAPRRQDRPDPPREARERKDARAGEVLRRGEACLRALTCSTGTTSWRESPPTCPSGTSPCRRSWPRPRRPAASPCCPIPAPISSGRRGKTSRTSSGAGWPASRSTRSTIPPSRSRLYRADGRRARPCPDGRLGFPRKDQAPRRVRRP